MLLADRTVLLVDEDEATLDRLGAELKGQGARCFPARNAAAAAWGARETLPDVIVCALELTSVDPWALVGELRSAPELAKLAAVGLASAPERASSVRGPSGAKSATFEKLLPKSTATGLLIDALCSVLGEAPPSARDSAPSVELMSRAIARHDYRHLLGALNAATSHRYSALFRCDGVGLASVWTFDRHSPEVDPFPLRVPIAATPCATLLRSERPLAVDDTSLHAAVPEEQRHLDMRAFVGVRLVAPDGAAFGALCHFDPAPRASLPNTLSLLEIAANMLAANEYRRQRK